MSNVSNTNQVGSTQFLSDIAADPNTASLSPESLLVYCSARLTSLDDNIQKYVAEQRTLAARQKDWSDAIGVFRWGDGGHVGSDQIKGDPKRQQEFADKGNAIREKWLNTTDPKLRDACAAEFLKVTGRPITDFEGTPVTPADIKASADQGLIQAETNTDVANRIESYKDEASAMSKNSELNMIQLQSLVSQRQLAVQLTTQLMQTLHETNKAVVGNIRS